MTPLDLTEAPPRSPREELRGLCALPRMIDIARAMLPGGNKGEYQIGREKTLSAVIFAAFGISAAQFVDIVRDAETDDDVADKIWPVARIPPAALGARLQRIKVADVPTELQPDFQQIYGAHLPADRLFFDVLEADDARTFTTRPERTSGP